MAVDTHIAGESLHAALGAAERAVGEFFAALSAEEFVLRSGTAWTPAQHLDHLNIAVSAVARGFGMKPWLLRLRFGRARRASRTYDQLRDDYRALLEQGGGATGRFVPGQANPADDDSIVQRTRLLSRWYRVNARLQTALRTWSDAQLDRVLLPHPLLGRITAREMVFFTIYHAHHHIAAASRRLPRFQQTETGG